MAFLSRRRRLQVTEFGLTDPALRERYDRLFERCPAAFIQQSTWWAEVIAGLGPDQPIFLLCSEGSTDLAGLPLYLFQSADGKVLTSVPQAGPLGGVFCPDDLSAQKRDEVYRVLLRRAVEIAGEQGCISVTIISNPFRDDRGLYEKHFEPTLTLENFTQSIALDEVVSGGQITLRDYHRRTRLSRNLRKAHEAGFTVSISQTASDLDRWYAIHAKRHRELGANPLPFDLFRRMFDVLKPRGKCDLILVKDGDRIASGCVYIWHRDIMDVFMLSMDSEWSQASPNFANTEYSLLWAASLGVRIYNWQGAPSRDSGVYTYKKEWGSVESSYSFVTRTLQPLDSVMALGPERLRAAFPWHYVVPFGGFEDGFASGHYRKGEPVHVSVV